MVAYAGTIPCFHVNSASYYWIGGNYRHESYPKEIHDKYPWISYTCPYRDPLFAFITLNPKTGTIAVQGQDSIWIGPSPQALGQNPGEDLRHGYEIVPQIQPRQIKRGKT